MVWQWLPCSHSGPISIIQSTTAAEVGVSIREIKCLLEVPCGVFVSVTSYCHFGKGTTLPCKKKIVEKPPRNSAGFCGGGQVLRWAVEPRKAAEEEEGHEIKRQVLRKQATDLKYNLIYFYLSSQFSS
jgi:hypothetical protein